jgi:hypothetical protein
MYKATVILLAIIIFSGFVYFSNADEVVVNEQGKIEGLVNKARAVLQGKRFWRLQLKMATEKYNEGLAPHLPSSAEMQAMYRKLREDEKALDDKMKVLYTPEEQMAMMLRLKADSLERAGKWRLIDDDAEASRTKDNEKFKAVIPIIEAKLHIVTP